MYGIKRDKKDEEDGGGGNPFANIEKTAVLQEARTFNETPVNPRKCGHILTKILYLINQGETLGTREATDAFFAMTKLFQCKETVLRRLVYLAIKELSKTAEDVIIVTSSLTKDMTGKEDHYRAAAIRALCQITDGTMLQAIERYMKQAIVDKSHSISSAALVSSLHLMRTNADVVKRWVNEAQQAITSDNPMVQYHALGLLYHIRRQDRLAVSKLMQRYTRATLKSPYAVCLLIRIASKLIEENGASGDYKPLLGFIESSLRHKSEMVIYEAAHAMVNLSTTASNELKTAVSVLQLFCSSPKATLRFAAVRTLNKVAMTHPQAVSTCTVDLEQLITDSNRSIATLAITTLLKTASSETSVERLMRQISTYVSEISDEFKIIVVEAIRSFCQKFPRKHAVLMSFLSSMVRDDGGYEYKRAIVDTIIHIIEDIPEAKEAGLLHLCEFIEDCEHATLAVRILALLGREGPSTSQPSKYIRYMYNRLILETAQIRAAAISALAKFAIQCPQLRQNLMVLLERSVLDDDDEVRDRASYYLHLLRCKTVVPVDYLVPNIQISAVGVEKYLTVYLGDKAQWSEPFDFSRVSLIEVPPAVESHKTVSADAKRPIQNDVAAPKAPNDAAVIMEQLSKIPQLASFGPPFKSSTPVQLTESETEYVVQCIKHTYQRHFILQFDCTNTLSDQLLEDVTVSVEPASPEWRVVSNIACPQLAYNIPGTCYAVVEIPEEDSLQASFECTLRYLTKECDPTTGEADPNDDGYRDDYALEGVEIALADHMQRLLKMNFGASWEALGEENELEDTFVLGNFNNIPDAVKNIMDFVGMAACERSDRVPEGKVAHTLLLGGLYRGGVEVLVRAKLAATNGVTMQLTVRSGDPQVSELIVSAIG